MKDKHLVAIYTQIFLCSRKIYCVSNAFLQFINKYKIKKVDKMTA